MNLEVTQIPFIKSEDDKSVVEEKLFDDFIETFLRDDDDDDDDDMYGEDEVDERNTKNCKVSVKQENSKSSTKERGSKGESKKRKFNPDAEVIAAVTEEALKELDLDPNSQDAKKKRRQIRNRLSAQFHRDRKNAYIKQLEETVQQKDLTIGSLNLKVVQLEGENVLLKQRILDLESKLAASMGNMAGVATVSDSDSSVCRSPSPESDSPVLRADPHLPITINSTSPNFFASTLPSPLVKSLSFISVICILCVTLMNHPLPSVEFHGSSVTEALQETEISSSSHLSSLNSPSQTLSLQIIPVQSHRRLDAQNEQEEVLQIVEHEQFTRPQLAAPTKIEKIQEFQVPKLNITPPVRRHLRSVRSQNIPVNSTLGLAQNTSVIATKDLIPFTLPSEFTQDWYSNKDSLKYLSFSHIVMNNGVALFDPSLNLGYEKTDNHFATSSEKAKSPFFNLVPQIPVIAHKPAADSSVETDSDLIGKGIVSYDESRVKILSSKPPSWPMLPPVNHDSGGSKDKKIVPTTTTPMVAPDSSASSGPCGATDCSRCAFDQTSMMMNLLSSANLVTVRLPATSVRTGKSVTDSKEGTVEGIMQMFNLTKENVVSGDKQAFSLLQSSIADASVEINCIILGAKLVLNSPSKQ